MPRALILLLAVFLDLVGFGIVPLLTFYAETFAPPRSRSAVDGLLAGQFCCPHLGRSVRPRRSPAIMLFSIAATALGLDSRAQPRSGI